MGKTLNESEKYGRWFVWVVRLLCIIPSIYCVILSTQVNTIVFFITFALAIIKNTIVMLGSDYALKVYDRYSLDLTFNEREAQNE